MIPWKLLDTATVPGSRGELRLYQHESEFSIRINGRELMNSSAHGSEDALAELPCARIAGRAHAKVLVGGLGMGFTAAAALRSLGPDGEVVVAEIVPAVVKWTRHELAELTGNVLADRRVTLREVDIVEILRDAQPQTFDAVLLDVDNGPEALTRRENSWLYSESGLIAAKRVLRPQGILTVWSAAFDNAFVKRLRAVGFEVEETLAREREGKGRKKHTIWLATKR